MPVKKVPVEINLHIMRILFARNTCVIHTKYNKLNTIYSCVVGHGLRCNLKLTIKV